MLHVLLYLGLLFYYFTSETYQYLNLQLYILQKFCICYVHVIHSTIQDITHKLLKFTYIEICVIMCNDEHNDDYNVVLMWFLDIDDAVQSSRDEEHDGDETGMSCICGDTVKFFLMCISYRMYMTCQVNCDMYWQSFVYDFLMLHLCYTYVHILNYDITFA